MAMERGELAELVVQFTEAFNREDLDGVMSFMAEDAVYDEFNGTINRGTAAIRAASITVTRPAPAARAASTSSGTAAGSPAAPITTACPDLKMPAFSPAIAASVSPSSSL